MAAPLVFGVLNVTADSFSDGGKYINPSIAVEHALAMVAAGADVIDIGGESTRPGAERVEAS
ncbi:MAG: Dihydropteroate synthase 1, partial [Actinomycetota bacterium]